MQISKCFLVVCAAAYATAVLPLHAADTDTDKKLREALDKKLNELQTQPLTATPQPSVATPSPRTPTAPAAAPAPSVEPADSETIAKAREALRQKMVELQSPPGGRPVPPAQWTPTTVVRPSPPVAQPTTPAPAVQPVPTPAIQPVPAPSRTTQPAPAVAQPAPAPAVQPTPQPTLVVPPPVSEESIAKARQALRQKMDELEGQAPVPTTAPAPAPVPAVTTPAPAVQPAPATPQATTVVVPATQPRPANISKKTGKGPLVFPPIQGPPPAISADKDARLAELLRKYKADEITPEEYHQQRAKILSEP